MLIAFGIDLSSPMLRPPLACLKRCVFERIRRLYWILLENGLTDFRLMPADELHPNGSASIIVCWLTIRALQSGEEVQEAIIIRFPKLLQMARALLRLGYGRPEFCADNDPLLVEERACLADTPTETNQIDRALSHYVENWRVTCKNDQGAHKRIDSLLTEFNAGPLSLTNMARIAI